MSRVHPVVVAPPYALRHSDVVVSTVPDEQLVAERMVLDRGGLLINVSAMAPCAAPC